MFRIGEFSKLTRVSIRMLRHYDETGLLKPAETDRFTNYRLYAAEQIPELNRIVFLRDLGFNVSEIADALGRWDDGYIAGLLESKRLDIENAIENGQDRLSRIEQAKKDIKRDSIEINYNVSIKSIPGYQVLSLRRTVPSYNEEGQLWQEMEAFAAGNDIRFSNNTFSIYHDAEYKDRDVDIEVCAPVAVMGEDADGFVYRETEPVPIMACTMAYGPFDNLAGAYLAFANWLQEHNRYRMAGQSRLTVHRGPWNEGSPDNYLSEIQIPLERIY